MELYGARFRYVEKKRVRMEEEVREEVGNEFIDLAPGTCTRRRPLSTSTVQVRAVSAGRW
jgi:hypothetical protein